MENPEYKQKLDRYQETFFGSKLQQHLPGIIELSNIGCCPRCTFRFTNQRNLAIYQEKSEVLNYFFIIILYIIFILFYCFSYRML